MFAKLLLIAVCLAAASATELTNDNYDSMTAGKTVFLKFFAPWCGHCKKMKPDWDKLMANYANNDKTLIADVDCTAGGKDLCEQHGVKGFPTLKHGDPSSLEDYEGGRDMASLEKFAAALKPVCSPANQDLCDEEGKAAIEAVMKLSDDELAAEIAEGDKKLAAAEETFKAEVEKLQAKYQELMSEKDETIAAVKKSGLGLRKSVAAHKKKQGAAKAKEEL